MSRRPNSVRPGRSWSTRTRGAGSKNAIAARADEIHCLINASTFDYYRDGFDVGVAGGFNGAKEPLTLSPGPHRLELRATGYETSIVDVNVQAGKTLTYRMAMRPAS